MGISAPLSGSHSGLGHRVNSVTKLLCDLGQAPLWPCKMQGGALPTLITSEMKRLPLEGIFSGLTVPPGQAERWVLAGMRPWMCEQCVCIVYLCV